MRIRLLLASALGAAVLIPASAGASPVYFLQGEQAVPVQRPGTTLQAAMTALLRGPTGAEKEPPHPDLPPRGHPAALGDGRGRRRHDRPRRAVRAGTDSDTLLARLSQVVTTATAVPGVTSVQVLIQGGVPLGLFPGIDATKPLTTAALRTPNVAPPRPRAAPARPRRPRAARARSSAWPTSATCCRAAWTARWVRHHGRGDRVPEVGGPAARRRCSGRDPRWPA